MDRIAPFFTLDLGKRSDGESRSSRSNSSRKSDDLLRKSKRRKSSNSRKDKVKEVSSHDITGGEEPASSTTSSTESTKHTTFAEDDLEHRHYGDNIGNEVFYETLTALLSAAKGTIPFISDCFSREYVPVISSASNPMPAGSSETFLWMKSVRSWLLLVSVHG